MQCSYLSTAFSFKLGVMAQHLMGHLMRYHKGKFSFVLKPEEHAA
jgi:hypothetical protein